MAELTDRSKSQLASWLMAASVPLASFLSFSIQPLEGKLLLPSQGGGAATWLGTMLFFQVSLLAGYSLAAWLTAKPRGFQVKFIFCLAVAAALLTHVRPAVDPTEGSIVSIFSVLSLSLLPAALLMFCTPTLLHDWWGSESGRPPYHLYALSNIGSLLALIAYPFFIEPAIPLSTQILIWRVLLVLFAVALGVSAWCVKRTKAAPSSTIKEAAAPSALIFAFWAVLAACSCIVMLAATQHIAAEIGSSPLAWVGPFGLYLLSFSIIFSGIWRPQFTPYCVVLLALSLTGFLITKGVAPTAVAGWSLWWLLCLSTAGTFLANAVLYQQRPVRGYEYFYLALAIGGVLGGLFVSLVAPFLFSRPFELIFASAALLVFALIQQAQKPTRTQCITLTSVVAAPIFGLILKQTADVRGTDQVTYFRNIYGNAMVRREASGGVVLSNETTTHGSQLTADLESQVHPTLYYSESTAAGRMLLELQKSSPALNVGIIGLGAGTLAAYTRTDDHYTFWDIDPKAELIARKFFHYLQNAKGEVSVIQRDGRKGIQESREQFDALIIDAFTGDSIPYHLLTHEAFWMYKTKLEHRHGILAIHVSNRYSRVFPVVSATARSVGLVAINVVTNVSASSDIDWDPTQTQYILVCDREQAEYIAKWFPAEEDNGRVKRTVDVAPTLSPQYPTEWTDERSSILDTLELDTFLRAGK